MTTALIDLQERLADRLGSRTAPSAPELPLDTPAAETPLPAAPRPSGKLTVQRLAVLIRELSLLGTRFHVLGPHLTVTGREGLPQPLANLLDEFERSGWLRGFFGCDRAESSALQLITRLGVQAVLVRTKKRLRQALLRLIEDQKIHGPEIGLDIETAPNPEYRKLPPAVKFTQEGVIADRQGPSKIKGELEDKPALDPHRSHIASVQLYCGGEHAFVIRGPALALLLRSGWFRCPRFMAHNSVFEASFIDHYCARPGRRPINWPIECTMQMTGLEIGCRRSAYGGRSLANAAKVIGKIAVGKSFATSNWDAEKLSPGQIAYAAADSVIAYKLWRCLRPKLKERLGHGMSRWTAYELQRDAGLAVARMQNRGLLLDREEHARQVEEWSQELAKARHTYHEATGKIPPSTDNEVRAWLETVITPDQRRFWPSTDTGQLSIKHRDLARVREAPNAKTVMTIREKQTLLRTFGERLARHINPVTGRIHGSFEIAAAGPGRFAAADPNLQQLPVRRNPKFRECIIAGPGYRIVVCDWGQVELRALAWLYHDEALMNDLVNGDVHRRTAARINGISLEAVTDEQRYSAKAVNFGAIYGISPDGLRQNIFADFGIEMTFGEAERALNQFASVYHRAWSGRERFAKECQARGYIVVPTSGRIVRKQWFTYGKLTNRQCFNSPVQGSCADAMLRAVALIDACLVEGQIRGGLIACVHDELLLEVHEDDAEIVRALLEDVMIDAFSTTFPGAPTKGVAAAAIGQNWAEAKQ
jgi:DNA polymerase I-like protein with 3'-5' exonuclease and polymerase domains